MKTHFRLKGRMLTAVAIAAVMLQTIGGPVFSQPQVAEAVAPTYNITASINTSGIIDPPGTITSLGTVPYNSGDYAVYSISAYYNTVLVDVQVDGVSVGPVSMYEFPNIAADHTINASFADQPSTVNVNVSANVGGTVTNSGSYTVPWCSPLTITATPDPGYHQVSFIENGFDYGQATTSSGYGCLTSDLTISVIFAPDAATNEIFAAAEPFGTISPAGPTTVNFGSNQTYTITPSRGYIVDYLTIDGTRVDPQTSYTFYNVTTPHSIIATFIPMYSQIVSTAGPNGTITPEGVNTVLTNYSFTFNISPNLGYEIASVMVDGVSQGAINTYTFTNVKGDHTINAIFTTPGQPPSTIAYSAGLNGSIVPFSSNVVPYGGSLSFYIIPDINYYVQDVQVDGVSVGPWDTYTFTNVTADHTISATFTADTNQVTSIITSSAGPNGSISPLGQTLVPYFGIQTFFITPDPGFGVQDIVVDGVSQGPWTDYSFTDVTTSHTIDVSFTSATYAIDVTFSAGGSVTSSLGDITAPVLSGEVPMYTFTPDPGYWVADVLVDGYSVGFQDMYQFDPINADHTLHVEFSNTDTGSYEILAMAGLNGTITPDYITTLSPGGSQTYTIIPDLGFQVTDVLVDGISVGPVNTYTFSNVNQNHYFEAYFEAVSTLTVDLNSGWNLITLPIQELDPVTNLPLNNTAESIGQLFGADVVTEWNSGSQQYSSHIVGLPVNNFQIPQGMGFFIHVNSAKSVSLTGANIPSTMPALSVGWNLVGWTDRYTTSSAEIIGDFYAGSDVVSKFDSLTQQWVSHIVNLPINNFIINLGDAVFVHQQ